MKKPAKTPQEKVPRKNPVETKQKKAAPAKASMFSANRYIREGETAGSFKCTAPSTRALTSRLAKSARASAVSIAVLAKAAFAIFSLARSAASLALAFARAVVCAA